MVTRSPAIEKLARRIAERMRDMEARFVQHGYADGLSEAMHAIMRRVDEGCLDDLLDGAVVSERMRRYLLDCARDVEVAYEATPGGDHTFAAELRRLAGEE